MEFHLYPQERVVPEGLPTAAIRGCYLSRDPIRLLVVDKQAGGAGRRVQRGRQCRAIPRDRTGGSGRRFHPRTSAASDSPMLADWEGTVAVCGVAPPPPLRAWRDVSAPSKRCVYGWRAVPLSARGTACCRFPAPACWSNARRPVRLADFVPARWSSFWTCTTRLAPRRRRARRLPRLAGQLPACRGHMGRSAPPGAARSATTDRSPATNGHGGGREFFGLFCLRALRPLLETVAYLLAAPAGSPGWCPGPGAARTGDGYRHGNRDLDGGRGAA